MKSAAAMLSNFYRGLTIVLHAAAIFLTTPSYWLYALLPWLICLAGYLLLAAGFAVYLLPWLGRLLPDPAASSEWLGILMTALRWSVYLTAVLTALALLLFTYSTAAMMVAAPFIDALAARFEKDRYQLEFAPADAREWLHYYWTTTVNPLRIGIKAACWGLLLLPVSMLIPVVGFLLPATVLGYYFGVMAALYGAEHRRRPYREFKRELRGSRALLAGVGMPVYLGMSVPLLAILLLPAAAIAGVIVYNRHLLPRQGDGAAPAALNR